MTKDSIIRKGDIKHVLSYVSDNPVGRIVLWEFVQEKWQDLVDLLVWVLSRGKDVMCLGIRRIVW